VRRVRGITALVAAVSLLSALGGLPPGVTPVRAAEYSLSTEASYAVHPDDRRVDVTVKVTFRNTTPNPPGHFSVFYVVDLAVQTGAREVRASDRRGKLQVGVSKRNGVTVATVHPRSGVRYRDTVHFTLRYAMPDGASDDVRIRTSVVTFPVWSFGTHGTVEVHLPADYEVLVDGNNLKADRAGDTWKLTSGTISDPTRWLAVLTATLPSAFVTASKSLSLQGGALELQVRSWADDRRWGRDTLELATRALPALEKAAGIPLRATGPLVLVESLPASGEIGEPASAGADVAVGFDEPPFTVLHQLAHAWYTPELTADRWIREGLASAAAATAARSLRISPPFDPATEARRLDADAFPLVSWGAGKASAEQDRYAYAASWEAADALRAAVGGEVMTNALRRFAAGLDGYQPLDAEAVPGQRVVAPFDSRHLFDQLDALSDAAIQPIFQRLIFDKGTVALLPERATARQEATQLGQEAGELGVPDPVRLALAGWRFDEARAAIREARDWLHDRDALAAEAEAAGLAVPDRLDDEYRTGGGGSAARAELDAERAVVTAYAGANARLGQPRSPVEQIGLLGGADPRASLDEARSAFAGGDLVGASELANTALDRLQQAGRDGLVRLVSAVVILIAMVVALIWLVRRGRQRRIGGYTAGP